MTKQLDVWLLGSHIGTLSQVDGRLGFAYSVQWLDQADAGTGVATGGAPGVAPPSSPLSQSLPLRAEPFDDRATRPFFAGLLPEGDKRRLIAQALQVSRLPARLHQEDFCQALGVPPEHKYQNEGGPDLTQCFALLRQATRPSAPHILRLLDTVVVNALIGNHDAHGKNFSILYGHAGAGLAPLYDALSTAVYPQLTDKMAMKIGGKYRFTEVMARHWEQFARDAGLSPAQAKRRILEIARRLPDLARDTQALFDAQGDSHPILGQIVALTAQRCDLTIRRLTAPAADPA